MDASYRGYFGDIGSIAQGLKRYRRQLPSSVGPVELVYFDNLVWNGQGLSRVPKPELKRDFTSFSEYRGFLSESIGALHSNMRSDSRRFPYAPLGTISTGYDSPTVAVLSKPHGLTNVLSFDETRYGLEDSGEAIADALALTTHVQPRDSWKEFPDAEAIFISADAKGGDVVYAGADELLMGCSLFTGFHGDKVWDANSEELGSHIVRGDRSGLGLTEFRLRLGFQHVPVPFLGVRQLNDIIRLSKSPEMAPWRLENDYDRPICRRIVEEAGIPREMFGMTKKFVSADLLDIQNMSQASRDDYLTWLKGHARYGGIGLSLFGYATLLQRVRPLRRFIARAMGYVGRRIPLERVRAVAERWSTRLSENLAGDPFFVFAFPWAIARASKYFSRTSRADRR